MNTKAAQNSTRARTLSATEAVRVLPTTAPEPIREVQGLLTTLSDQIAQIESKFDHLSARVAPVCAAQVPEAPRAVEGESLVTTKIGQEIYQAISRLRCLSVAIGELESRIQL